LEDSIALCHALKQEVGSYALMAGTGFEQFDFLQCCKFAEGDSRYWFLTRILMQKMARDLNSSGAKTEAEKLALGKLRESLQVEMKKGATKLQAWDRSWELVYELAEVHMRGILEKVLGVPVKAKF
jgi:acyl-CoA oxidase